LEENDAAGLMQALRNVAEAHALLEHAIGLDEFSETALKRPAVEVQAFGLAGLPELSNAQARFVGSQQGGYFIKLLFVNSFWHFCVAKVSFLVVITDIRDTKPSYLSRFRTHLAASYSGLGPVDPPVAKLTGRFAATRSRQARLHTERVIRLAAASCLAENNTLVHDFVHQFVARLQVQCGPYGLWNGGLRLVRQLADDYVRSCLEGKEFIFSGQQRRSVISIRTDRIEAVQGCGFLTAPPKIKRWRGEDGYEILVSFIHWMALPTIGPRSERSLSGISG